MKGMESVVITSANESWNVQVILPKETFWGMAGQ